MKKHRTKKNYKLSGESQMSELLILPDGQILVHNLTQPFAELLHELNPDDDQSSSPVTRPPLLCSGAASHPSPKL
ncbi:MAG: hypothetical protein ACLP2Y_01640 [Limisphaerales bacterium]